jgi:cell division protein FtsQ
VSNLLTPRTGDRPVADLGERSVLVARQRVGRGRRRRRPWPRALVIAAPVVLAVVLAATAAGLAVRWMLTSPRFAVTSVEVRGALRVPPERILAASGLTAGQSLFRVDPADVVARLEAMPEIRRAELIRELPDRLTIFVEERRPFTLVHGGRLHWVDEEGRLLGEERRAVTTPVPLISGLGEDELATMRTAPGPRARAALAIIRALLRSGSALTAEIAEIDVSGKEGPVLYTVDGIEVRLGQDDWDDRLARLEGVLAQVAAREGRVTAVDLRFRDQVVLRGAGQP